MAKTVNILKGEGHEQATSSQAYEKKNYKMTFKKNNKKSDKNSLKRQVERKVRIPTMEEMEPHRGFIEYKMPAAMAKDILSSRQGKEKGIDPQKYLCDYVNEQCGLIGYCLKVIIS